VHFPELLPLPPTEEAPATVCQNLDVAQVSLSRRVLVENPQSYLRFLHSTIPEWEFPEREFIAAVVECTGHGSSGTPVT
jgi:uncharacterized protein (UPF0276 family)